ncbi:ABC transporter ATP-binding protein [Terribacillus saccharophilus]|uniref:ABC transporter ATP-binding protein n=1 Tax=Terribacillus saccharophilus TaxID=361277 RepID=A0ABX4GUL9_9BACI|nr:ABC transporter ATP-binding protein [Terribacillus saccharophilus]PAD34238.1 ABC transporter ATP-binding protein [Terribacillus saccharophilus]PAD94824.1 ABC transporter ATP-binding protein [Terribacillus saccharophilus]PAD98573.1 ABC transporter ATP-binding protein [Terribacillus saccharophilus]
MTLEINNITKKFEKNIVLNDISVALESGVYGLLGANGSGKTTLMRIICGVIKANEGTVIYNGEDTNEKSVPFRSILGFLPQDFRYYPDFTGLKFLLYMAALKGLDNKTAKEKCNELLHLIGLEAVKNKKIKKYSGGMKQRLGIAQAMINDPKVLILDEPTVGLDPKERVRFRNLISSFSKEKIIILSTHIVSDVEYIADEILILNNRKVENRGTAVELVKEIEGQVWECIVQPAAADEMRAKYIVSNEKHETEGMILRVISKEQPTRNATMVQPTLEDLYLYYLREEVGK